MRSQPTSTAPATANSPTAIAAPRYCVRPETTNRAGAGTRSRAAVRVGTDRLYDRARPETSHAGRATAARPPCGTGRRPPRAAAGVSP